MATSQAPEKNPSRRRRARWLLGGAGLLMVGLLSTNGSTSLLSTAHGFAAESHRAAPASPLALMTLADAPRSEEPLPADAQTGSPEQRLIAVYRLIAAGRMDAALQAAESLSRSHPGFKLAQLLWADLMSTRAGSPAAFGGPADPTSARQTELNALRDEARLRLGALQERPPADAVPGEFLSLPRSTRFAVAVDTSRARLYLFENGAQGLRLVEDFYVSVGRQGVDKLAEGDQKTPLGVYFVTGHLEPRLLQQRFGAGALPLNYPNAYDKLRGRTGSGILLHGVPTSTYARPPLDSDGCVAMANEDLLRLSTLLPDRDTPVVITRRLHWVPREGAPGTDGDASFQQTVQAWQQARLRADQQALQRLYEGGAPTDKAVDGQALQRLDYPTAGIADVSVVTWHDDPDKRVVTFRERTSAQDRRDHLLRQYWSRSAGEWRIVAEGMVR